jgi:hypothetical protein
MEGRHIEVHHPAKLIRVLTRSMVEAEQIVGASGAAKKLVVLETTRRHAVHSLTADDAVLVTTLTPAIVDSVCAASNGLLNLNVRPESCCADDCCRGPLAFGDCCALL